MDLVVDAHSAAAYHSLNLRLRRPKSERGGAHVCYLQVIDEADGRLVGHPIKAAEMEHGFDGFCVPSENLRSFLVNGGVGPQRARVAHNAPVVQPSSIEVAYRLAATKARRLAAGKRPLRLLFAGRADYQKGLSRLKGMTDLLIRSDVPFQLTFVGGAVIGEEHVTWPAQYVVTDPPTHDKAKLAAYYAEADVFVLLSRWEGVPLSLLDAMAHGCVVLATDVGGVSELVDGSRNGHLLPNGRDEDVAAQAAAAIEEVLRDPTGSAAMRREAVATAWRYSWDETAKVFLSFLPDAVKVRHGLAIG
jgi:glycosyltransferase involved in cell wall biosynthesis